MSKHYGKWINFTDDELKCSCCGEFNESPEFHDNMDHVQALRTYMGFSFVVTSAYRCPKHKIEARKTTPGQHAKAAIDFQVPTDKCHRLVEEAFKFGFTGIGINLTGSHSQRFIHLDRRKTGPRLWSY